MLALLIEKKARALYNLGMEKVSILGARTLKTVIAVFACFVIDSVRSDGLPFFSSIAAVLCIKKTNEESFVVALNREVATLIGGFWGAAFMAVEFYFHPALSAMARNGVVALLLIPLIDFCVFLNQKKATTLSCIVFLCIVIAHSTDATPFDFAVARIVDTTIGVVTALICNGMPIGEIKRAIFKTKESAKGVSNG